MLFIPCNINTNGTGDSYLWISKKELWGNVSWIGPKIPILTNPHLHLSISRPLTSIVFHQFWPKIENYQIMLAYMNSTQWAQSISNHKIGVTFIFKWTVYIIITQLLFGDINVADMKTLEVFEVHLKLDKMWLTSTYLKFICIQIRCGWHEVFEVHLHSDKMWLTLMCLKFICIQIRCGWHWSLFAFR